MTERQTTMLMAGLLAVLAAGAYWPALDGPFLLDDIPAVVEHPVVQGEQDASAVWSQTYWGDRTGYEKVAIYRPLVTLSFRLNQWLSPGAAWGFHVGNLLLHIAVTWLLFGLLRRMTSSSLSWVGAAVFAFHPVHVDAVAAIANRTELMAAFFGLLMLRVYLDGRKQPSGWRMWLSVALLWGCAVLSKESAVVWPFILAAWEWGERKRNPMPWRGILALVGAVALYLGWRILVLEDPFGGATPWQDNPLHRAEGVARWGTPFELVSLALELLVVPLQLSVDYTFNAIPLAQGWGNPELLVGAFVVVVAAGGLMILTVQGEQSWWRLGLLILVVPYGLVSHFLFPGTILFAERLLYLPSAGFIVLGVLMLEDLWERGWVRGWVAVWAVGLFVLTFSYCQQWSSPEKLFESALESRPGSARMHVNLGHLALEAQRPTMAEKQIGLALDIDGESPEALVNMGAAVESQGRHEEALQWYTKGTEVLDGTYGLAHINRCRIGVGLGIEEGLDVSCSAGVRLRGDLAASWVAKGRYLEQTGAVVEAEQAFVQAVNLEPASPLPLHELGGFYSRQRNGAKRYRVMRQLLDLSPQDEALRRALIAETRLLMEAAEKTGDVERMRILAVELKSLERRP